MTQKAATKADAPAASAGGLVVFVDPATGKVRQPSADEIGALAAAQRAGAPAARPPQARRLTNGGTAFSVDPSYDSYSVVTVGPDGKLVMNCVEGQEKAEKAVAASASAPVKEALDEK